MKKRLWIKLSALCAVCVLVFSVVSPVFAAAADLSSGLTDDEIIVTAPQLEKLIKASSYETEYGGDSTSAEIDGYINGLRIDQNVTLKDNYIYQNSVNGKVSNLTPSDVTGSILVTEPQKLADSEYFYESKKSQVFSAVGAQPCNEIYPGSILTFSQNNIYEGNYTNNAVAIARSSGKLHLDVPKNDLTIDDLTYQGAQPALRIKQAMYGKMKDTIRGYEIRIASATSPEQLAASLGITKGAMDQAINNKQWSAIRNGEKQMTVVSVQQIISTLTFKNDLSYPSTLFGSGVGLSDVKKLGDSCMLVRKVNYGRQYLMTAELDLNCSPNEERIDLTDAVVTTFRGSSVSDEGKKNALNNAKVNAWEIGRKSTSWSEITDPEYAHSIPKFIKFVTDYKPYTNTKDNQQLVPISYEATVMGGSSAKNVTLNIEASEYNYKGKKGEQVTGLNFIDHANGSNTAHWIDSWGLDLDAFNRNNVIQEKQYDIIDAHNVTIDIPAYKIIYGYRFSLRNGKTHAAGVGGDAWIHSKSDSGHRLYNGWGLKITDDEGDSHYVRKHSLSNTSIKLEQQELSGTDRSRIDSSLNYNWEVTKTGNPLYSQCSNFWGVGWGSAESTWEYYSLYEYAGRNLEMKSDSGKGSSDPLIPTEVDPVSYDAGALLEEIKNSPNLSDELKALIADGNIPVFHFILHQDIQPDAELKALFEQQVKDYTIGQYMELILSMKIANDKYEIAELGDAVELAVDIPKALQGDNREYLILREHDGKVEPVKTWIGEDGQLHFMSDKFSTFAIAYRTVKGNDDGKDVKPAANTGIENMNSNLPIILSLLVIAICLGGVWFLRKK